MCTFLFLQIWSGSSDGCVAVTDLDSSVKLDTGLARSLKTPSGKGVAHVVQCRSCLLRIRVHLHIVIYIHVIITLLSCKHESVSLMGLSHACVMPLSCYLSLHCSLAFSYIAQHCVCRQCLPGGHVQCTTSGHGMRHPVRLSDNTQMYCTPVGMQSTDVSLSPCPI